MSSRLVDALLAVSGSLELSVAIKVTVLLSLGLVTARCIRHGRASRRHAQLAATFATILVLPVVILVAPSVSVPIPTAGSPVSTTIPPASSKRPPSDTAGVPTNAADSRDGAHASSTAIPRLVAIGRVVWLVGVGLLLVAFALDLRRIGRLRRFGLPWPEPRERLRSLAAERGVNRSVALLVHETVSAPLTFGVWRPAIVLPDEARAADSAEIERVLIHELEHIRRGDWFVQVAARFACALYWFHPLVWIAWRQLRLEAERTADDAVLDTAERTEYADQLVSLARRLSSAGAHEGRVLGMANRSDLAARVAALLDDGQRRGRAGVAAVTSIAGVAILAVVAIAPVRAVARPPVQPIVQVESSHDTDSDESGPSRLDKALLEAAEEGDLRSVERLIDAGANVNGAIDGDGSPLIAAARAGRTDAVLALLDRGADPNLGVRGDGNPLIAAAREGHEKVVAILLDRGAEIDAVVPDDENALIQASAEGRLDVVELLVGRGADVNARVWVEHTYRNPNGEWRSPLIMARKGRHDAVAKFLVTSGAKE